MATFNGSAAYIEDNRNKRSALDADDPTFDFDECYPNFTAMDSFVYRVFEEEFKTQIGDIETTLDGIIAIQNTLIGGATE